MLVLAVSAVTAQNDIYFFKVKEAAVAQAITPAK